MKHDSGLTPQLSVRSRSWPTQSHGDSTWHFIHGRSARTKVRRQAAQSNLSLFFSAAQSRR
jgi:hypothetical protein